MSGSHSVRKQMPARGQRWAWPGGRAPAPLPAARPLSASPMHCQASTPVAVAPCTRGGWSKRRGTGGSGSMVHPCPWKEPGGTQPAGSSQAEKKPKHPRRKALRPANWTWQVYADYKVTEINARPSAPPPLQANPAADPAFYCS